MYNILLDLLFGGTSAPELSANQTLVITCGAILLVLLCFFMISLALYKLMLYICKF